MGNGGNGHDDGPQIHGEGRGSQRHENESRARDENVLRARLEKLTDALAAQHREERETALDSQERETSSGAPGNVLSLAFRVMSEFVAAVLVGTALGWGIDRLAGTSPTFLIVFLLLGAAAGFWNVYRIGTEKLGAERK